MRFRLLFKLILVVVALVAFNALAERASAQFNSASNAIDSIATRHQ